MKIIILAGGGGKRLWPLSRAKKPKQFCALTSDQTMLEETFQRFSRVYDRKDIFISVDQQNKKHVLKVLPKFYKNNLIVEPERRDTAAAMGYAAAFLSMINENEPIAFIPSDHHIKNVPLFLKSLRVADQLIKKTGKMLDIAIKPTFPSTILGYTKVGKLHKRINSVSVYNFADHKEKPKLALAKKYLAQKNYLWHANYYMWTPAGFLSAFQQYAPDMHGRLVKIQQALRANKQVVANKEFKKIRKTSFDYAITEKMNKKDVLIIKGEFGWSDVGAWDVLYDHLRNQVDKQGNLVQGKCLSVSSKNNLVYQKNKGKMTAVVGLEDVIIVDTKDGLLVCDKENAQDVKKVSNLCEF